MASPQWAPVTDAGSTDLSALTGPPRRVRNCSSGLVKSRRGDQGRPRPVRYDALQPPPPRGISASSFPQPASRGPPGAAARTPSPGASLSSRASWARAPSGRAWQGPQMAAAPRRGWSRGGRRAPSRGSLGLAQAALASTGEGQRGEASTEPARVRAAAAKVQA